MNRVFFGKTDKEHEHQIKNKMFEADNKWFNGIDVGDYAFIRLAGQDVIALWKAKEWVNEEKTKLKFDELIAFNPAIEISSQFISLKLFVLDKTLLNFIVHEYKGKGFFELHLTKGSLEIIQNPNSVQEYIYDENNYRKIMILDSKDDINTTSEDVQIYKENDELKLYNASFIDNDTIYSKFKGDNYVKDAFVSHTKGTLKKQLDKGAKEISRRDATMQGFYELFIAPNEDLRKQRTDFISWLLAKGFNNRNATTCEKNIRKIEKALHVVIADEYEKDKCESLLSKIKTDSKIAKQKGKEKYESNIQEYKDYLGGDLEEIVVEDVDNKEILKSDSIANMEYISSNAILYGVPGCGKSYEVKKLLHLTPDSPDKLDNKFYKRILFHPEYSYSDFVGQIMPNTDGDKISYKFVPGPFSEILLEALKDPQNYYFLVIEEINRGNAPAIFGDTFQLLDRNDDGKSEYSIYNKSILDYFKDNKLKDSKGYNFSEVFIPSNLTIIATMNTCDQNVFTLDTAFKRRWRMHRISNDFDGSDIRFNTKIGDLNFTWKQFAEALNADIIENCSDGTAVEDKQLGSYFVSIKEINNKEAFAEKVFMYLWNDVVKYDKNQLFNSKYKMLDEVLKDFIANENVFNDRCSNLSELYLAEGKNE